MSWVWGDGVSELPHGWEEVEFGALNEYRSQLVDPSKHPSETFELYSVPRFPSGAPEIVDGASNGSTKQVVKPDDVLVCKINPRINRVWKVGQSLGLKQIGSSEWIVMRSAYVLSGYLRYLFSSPEFREMLCEGVIGVGGSLTRAQPIIAALL